ADGRAENVVVMLFQMSKFGEPAPGVPVKAMNPQRALEARFLTELLARHMMVRGQDMDLVATSAELVHHHETDQLITPEVVRRIKIGQDEDFHGSIGGKLSSRRGSHRAFRGVVPSGCARRQAVRAGGVRGGRSSSHGANRWPTRVNECEGN